jgi:adenylate cyclase
MSETRKLAAILCSDVVGYSRLARADEDRILARLRALRSDLIDPTIAVHHGRVVKRTGDGSIVEFRSVVDAVGCAIEVQNAMIERNAGVPEDRRIVFRIGIHLGDVVSPILPALDRWIAEQSKPRPSRAEALRRALADWLTGLGLLKQRND